MSFIIPKKMVSFFLDITTQNFLFIRPSDNNIDAEGFKK